MESRLASLFGAVALSACAAASAPAAAPAQSCTPSLDPGDAFATEGVEGVLVLRDEASACVRTTDAALADEAFSPKSTFKIANTLIGLETGVIEGETHRFPWDGAPRRLPDWEQDLDLAGALRVSCVPCFQEVAREVGADRMRGYLAAFDYGNQDLAGPIDQFWLDGPLRITPREQVEFVRRMLAGELAVDPSNVALIWRLLELQSGPGFTFRGKTGLGTQDGRAVGWLVGYVEREGHRWIYATLVLGRDDTEAEVARLVPTRRAVTEALLTRAHVLAARQRDGS